MNEIPTADREPVRAPGPGGSPSLLSTIRTVFMALGAFAMVFAAVFWILDETGTPTDVPYLLIGIAGLVAYNLARLPAYLRLLWPAREEPGEKFHRK